MSWVADRALLNIIQTLRSRDTAEWMKRCLEARFEYAEYEEANAVIESLRAYIDAVWAGPEAAKAAWQKVLKALKEFDEKEALQVEQRYERALRRANRHART